jgi:hypothetical protein
MREVIIILAAQSIKLQLMNHKKVGMYSGLFGTIMPLA